MTLSFIQLKPQIFSNNVRPDCLPLISATRDPDVIECKNSITVPENAVLNFTSSKELIDLGYNIVFPLRLLPGVYDNVSFTIQKISSSASPIANLLPILNAIDLDGCIRKPFFIKKMNVVAHETQNTPIKQTAPSPPEDHVTYF
uniref:Uncharacterized protein n=1 Tax=Dikerogammarus haemobaphes virus 1 TaxID=2704946 RepID=A0A6G9HE88_9VIRU|nr:hypothetical protein [Dikerogammarus haemobaphes virus 1]